MQIDFNGFFDDVMSNIEDIATVIIILSIGFIIGRLSSKVIDFIVNKTGVLKLIVGTTTQETTKKTSFTFINFIKTIVRWTIYLIAIGQAIEILGLESLNSVTNDVVTYLPNVVIALVIMIVGFIMAEKIIGAIDEFLKETKLPSNKILLSCVRYFIYIVSFIMALSQLRISTDVLLVIAGVFSFFGCIFVVIGTKDISSNFFAGLQIMWYKSLKVGDVVKTPEIEGVIEEIGIISSTVKSNKGEYVVIPNSKLANEIVVKKG